MPGPLPPRRRTASRGRVAKPCDTCRLRSEASALAVTQLILEIDEATMADLERRLSCDIPWHLDEETNVPICCPFPDPQTPLDEPDADACRACAPYLIHLKSSIAGFSTDTAYLTHRRQNIEKNTQPKPPVIHLDDDDFSVNSAQQTLGGVAGVSRHGEETPPLRAETPNLNQIEHLDRLLLLQSIRGRLIMNQFLQSDRAAASRLEGVGSLLAGTERLGKEKLDRSKARLIQLTAELNRVQNEVEEMRQAVEAVDEQRRRKCPNSNLSLTSPHPSSPVRAPTVTRRPSPANRGPQGLGLGNLSPSDVGELRKKLMYMKAPGYDQHPELFARWIQVHGNTRIKGIPIGPDLVVDLRDWRYDQLKTGDYNDYRGVYILVGDMGTI
ncbi:hypothetical protein B0H11DRAFT_2266603 [Mycena galericulata]|nr:hypothetical protein B0H11DRAFT_2266603 [Mycena galericulata]